MPQSIPAGLAKEHILKAISDLNAGIDHPFGQPTGYELVHGDKRYAPKGFGQVHAMNGEQIAHESGLFQNVSNGSGM